MVTISFRVSEEEARLIRSRARQEGLTVSEYLRRRTCAAMPSPGEPRRVRCRHTGAMIFAAPNHEPPLTTARVRELLAGFP